MELLPVQDIGGSGNDRDEPFLPVCAEEGRKRVNMKPVIIY